MRQSVGQRRLLNTLTLAGLCYSLMCTASVFGQGLVWSLPEDGSWIRYEGDYRQVVYRPKSNLGDLTLAWRRHLEIRSVGTENAEWNGANVACRWLEFEVITGVAEGEIKAGPGGHQIYKVLVPESEITGQSRDANQIPVEYLSVVKGYHQIDDAPFREIASGVFQPYPTVSLLRNFKDLSAAGTTSLSVTLGNYQASEYAGELVSEDTDSRSTNKTQVWSSQEVPFGLVKWTVQIDREEKDASDVRDNFKAHSQIRVTMEAHETGTGAQSKIFNP